SRLRHGFFREHLRARVAGDRRRLRRRRVGAHDTGGRAGQAARGLAPDAGDGACRSCRARNRGGTDRRGLRRVRSARRVVVTRFADHQPYGGAFTRVVPHLTVAQADLAVAAAELGPRLPLRSQATSAVLLERDQTERWSEVATFALEPG